MILALDLAMEMYRILYDYNSTNNRIIIPILQDMNLNCLAMSILHGCAIVSKVVYPPSHKTS